MYSMNIKRKIGLAVLALSLFLLPQQVQASLEGDTLSLGRISAGAVSPGATNLANVLTGNVIDFTPGVVEYDFTIPGTAVIRVDFQSPVAPGTDARIEFSYDNIDPNAVEIIVFDHFFQFDGLQWEDPLNPGTYIDADSISASYVSSGPLQSSGIDVGDISISTTDPDFLQVALMDTTGISGSVIIVPPDTEVMGIPLEFTQKFYVDLSATKTVIPEPSTYLMLGSMLCLAMLAKRKKKTSLSLQP